MAALGLVLNHRELIIIAVMGMLALVVAAGATLARPQLTIERTVSPTRVMRRDPARSRVTIAAPQIRLPLGRLVRALTAGARVRDRVADRVVERRLPRLAGVSSWTSVSYGLPTHRRGPVPVGPVGVVRADPLGLCQNEVVVGDVTELWVNPRVHALAPLSSGRKRDLEGPAHERASGSITFHSLREYVLGDDLRLVHWPSTARTGTLVVREQTDPSQPLGTVVLDTRRSSYEDEDAFDEAVDAAASVLMASTNRRFPVRLLTGAGLLAEAGPTRASGPALLHMLARLEWGDDGDLASLVGRMSTDRGGASLVVVTGEDPRGEASRLATAASRRYESLAVVRLAPGAAPGLAQDGVVWKFVAPDAERFAALWSEVA